jgi:hypothetical protein
MKRNLIQSLIMACMLLAAADEATAANFSFIGGYGEPGGFTQDDQYKFFSFQADGSSTVTLETVSYRDIDGILLGNTPLGNPPVTVTGGGFDPMLTLFRPTAW